VHSFGRVEERLNSKEMQGLALRKTKIAGRGKLVVRSKRAGVRLSHEKIPRFIYKVNKYMYSKNRSTGVTTSAGRDRLKLKGLSGARFEPK
jgi:hypothetical protein